jgi:hypothetical protein
MNKLSWFVVLALVTLASPAFAAEKSAPSGKNDEYSYDFEDDPLAAIPAVPSGERIRGHFHAKRTTLIRPRYQFIVELVKSAENF